MRRVRDSNPRYDYSHTSLAGKPIRPLWQLSVIQFSIFRIVKGLPAKDLSGGEKVRGTFEPFDRSGNSPLFDFPNVSLPDAVSLFVHLASLGFEGVQHLLIHSGNSPMTIECRLQSTTFLSFFHLNAPPQLLLLLLPQHHITRQKELLV